MKAIGVIPARYDSTRFPGKVLADIHGRPLIQYVYEEALKAKNLQDLLVATDDQRVLEAVQAFGGRGVITAKEHQSGTDRISEVVNPIDAQIVVNIQGDEPLIKFSMIDELVECLSQDSQLCMATLIRKIEEREELENQNVVKVVKDKNNFALYFSRLPVPHLRSDSAQIEDLTYYKHLGLYAYTKDFLFIFTHLPQGVLERTEQLEQLRALEQGYKIKLVETGMDTIGVDIPQDLERVKARLVRE